MTRNAASPDNGRDSPVDPGALLGDVIARKNATGHYRTMADTGRICSPTFFHGIAGVAYTALRVANPGELPCVLLFD